VSTFEDFLHYLLDKVGGADEGVVGAWHKRIDQAFKEIVDEAPIVAQAATQPAPAWAADMAALTSVIQKLTEQLAEKPAAVASPSSAAAPSEPAEHSESPSPHALA
jgi:hypothetical protein